MTDYSEIENLESLSYLEPLSQAAESLVEAMKDIHYCLTDIQDELEQARRMIKQIDQRREFQEALR